MRGVALVALLSLALVASSGCMSDGKDPTTSSVSCTGSGSATGATASCSGTPTPSGSSSKSGSGTAAPKAAGANRPPTGNVTVPLNVTAGANATFLLAGSDPDGDGLLWTLAFGDDATADGLSLPANATHAYAAPGLYNLTLTLSDGRVNVTVLANVTVANATVVPLVLPSTTLHVDDATDDGATPVTELTWFEASIDATGEEPVLVLLLQVDTLWPTTAALTPVSYSVAINGHQFDSFARYPIDGNPMTWDGAAYMAGGTSSWDTANNQVTFRFAFSVLDTYGIAYPFALHAQTNFGGLLESVADDLAPDSGDVPY